jgi:hypothetical protein
MRPPPGPGAAQRQCRGNRCNDDVLAHAGAGSSEPKPDAMMGRRKLETLPGRGALQRAHIVGDRTLRQHGKEPGCEKPARERRSSPGPMASQPRVSGPCHDPLPPEAPPLSLRRWRT